MADWNEAKKFLGRGWKFPVEVDPVTGRIKTSSYEEDIQEAIQIILLTKKGERVMLPDFGCGLNEYVFETMDYTTTVMMEQEIQSALILWEPRITDVSVHIEMDERESGKINIQISYIVRSTNNPYNLVYPYYISEGL